LSAELINLWMHYKEYSEKIKKVMEQVTRFLKEKNKKKVSALKVETIREIKQSLTLHALRLS